uniref:Uncharacterized protein n=1 Tax=Aegilops tauschii TaxID=37682 RepID=R7W0C2_AEGTA
MSHDPEDFFVYFELPAHKENAVCRGFIAVDDIEIKIKGWRGDDHDVPDDCKLHVRVVIEKMPTQLWSLEGAGKVLGDLCIVDRLDTRTHERDFFSCNNNDAALPPPPSVDRMQIVLGAEIKDKLAAPLKFVEGELGSPGVALELEPSLQPDLIGAVFRAPPPPAVQTAVQVGAVTQQILQLRPAGAPQAASALFPAPAPPLIAGSPSLSPAPTPRKRPAALPKSRAASMPVRHSAGQVALNSMVPVVQRAALQIVQGLGGLGPKERMTVKAAEALVRRFNELLL